MKTFSMGHSRYQGLWAQGASWVNRLWSLTYPAKVMGVVDCQRLIVQKIYIFKIIFCLINYHSNMKSLHPGTQRNTRGKKLMIPSLAFPFPSGHQSLSIIPQPSPGLETLPRSTGTQECWLFAHRGVKVMYKTMQLALLI